MPANGEYRIKYLDKKILNINEFMAFKKIAKFAGIKENGMYLSLVKKK